MRTHTTNLIRLIATLSLACCCGTAQFSLAAVDPAAMEKTLDALPAFAYGQKTINMDVIRNAVDEAASNPELRQQLENRFISILQGQSTRAAKDIACRNLGLVGSAKCVPSVAALLTNPELSHMARYCLEKLGNSEADKALRDALPKVTGIMKIGIISSLGARQDEKAVPLLASLLDDPAPNISQAAAFALGRIGDSKAIHILLKSAQAKRPPLQDCEVQAVLTAATKLSKNDDKTAVKVFKSIYANKLKLEHPERHQPAALAGLIRTDSGVEKTYLLPALAGTNVILRQTAAVLASEPCVNLKPVLEALPALPVAAQVDLLNSLSSRQAPEIKTAVLPFLDSGTPDVKLAALAALRAHLSATDVPILARLTAAAENHSVKQEASRILVSLEGANVNASIVKEFANKDSSVCVQMLNCLAARSATETASEVAGLLSSPKSEIRVAAIKALETISDESQLPAIINLTLNTHSDAEQTATFAAIRSICERTREKSLDAVLTGLNQAATNIKPQFFDFLATIGGSRGLDAVLKIARSEKDSTLQTFAIRALADWSTVDAAPYLLELTKTASNSELRTIVFRGYVRLCRESDIPETNKIKLLTEAVKEIQTVEQKQLFLGALGELSSTDALHLATPLLQDGQVSQEASFACVGIISKFGNQQKTEAEPILKNILHAAKNPSLMDSTRKQMKRLGISE